VQIVECSTTARAAIMASEDPTSAAIASKLSADLYGLRILCEGIEDSPHNRTRFLIVGHTKPAPSGRDKTSILFSVPHKAGSLYKAMAVFEQEKINLTMIESRPTKQMPWEYNFFIDFQGHEKDEQIAKALDLLREHALFVRVLGSYPEAE
jgi:chorismate mutase/prephenate dehydratase